MKLLNGDEQVRSPEWLRLEPDASFPRCCTPTKSLLISSGSGLKTPGVSFRFFFPLYLIYLCTVGA